MVLSDESVNRYGYRVISKGIKLDAFLKNPVMLWNHLRDDGFAFYKTPKPIGHWEDIEVDEKNRLVGTPVFDCKSETSREVAELFKEGTVNACSIGFIPLKTSTKEEDRVPGQKGMTVTEAELMEVSLVDIPANANAVKLANGKMTCLCYEGTIQDNHLYSNYNSKSMKLNKKFSAILAFFGIAPEKAEETEITEQQLMQLNGELTRLRTTNEGLVNALSVLKASKEKEIEELKAQIECLKKIPAEDSASLKNPKDGRLEGLTAMDKFNAFVKNNPEDLEGQLKLAQECGLIKDF